MKLISVGSSSSGNSYIIKAGSGVVIVDAGLSCIKIVRALESAGLSPCDVDAILVTHEHGDHIKSIRALSRKCENAAVFVSKGTLEGCEALLDVDEPRVKIVSAGDSETVSIGSSDKACADGSAGEDDMLVSVFALSHDTKEPVSYSVTYGDEKLSIVTDTGIITDEIYDEISDSTMLVLEANHDEDLLMYGEYPYHLKQRIKSDIGHLSNRAAGELLASVLKEREESVQRRRELHAKRAPFDIDILPMPVLLAHLSFHNNAPFLARQSVEEILSDAGFENGVHYTLDIAARDELTFFGSSED